MHASALGFRHSSSLVDIECPSCRRDSKVPVGLIVSSAVFDCKGCGTGYKVDLSGRSAAVRCVKALGAAPSPAISTP